MTYKTSLLRWAGTVVLAAASGLATAQQAATSVNPAAIAALEKMGGYLNSLKSFEVTSTTTMDEVLDNGQKVQFGGTVEFKVRRPDRLRVEVSTDRKRRMFFYDGKSVTMFGPRINYFATVAAPSTVAGLLDVLGKDYGIDIPLADLFYWGTEKARVADIKEADLIGPATIDGVACDHYAFRQEGVDWQLWIQKGATPLPRKLVITTTADPTQPQFTSVMRWKADAHLGNEVFAFVPPKGAHRIVMLTVDGKADSSAK